MLEGRLPDRARMAEPADAPDSKSGSRKRVGVQPSLRAPPAHQLNDAKTTVMALDMAFLLT